jgi:hypothetical protein
MGEGDCVLRRQRELIGQNFVADNPFEVFAGRCVFPACLNRQRHVIAI